MLLHATTDDSDSTRNLQLRSNSARMHTRGTNKGLGAAITWLATFPCFVSLWGCSASGTTQHDSPRASAVAKKAQAAAISELKSALAQSQTFVKVHAAEGLLRVGERAIVEAAFEKELQAHGDDPAYRIGIWRVLAQAANNKEASRRYLDSMQNALAIDSPDWVDAAESLAKLQYEVTDADRAGVADLAQQAAGPSAVYLAWYLAQPGRKDDVSSLADFLDSDDAEVRGVAAYALRHLSRKLPRNVVSRLNNAATQEQDSTQRVYLISADFATTTDNKHKESQKKLLVDYLIQGSNEEKYEAASALAVGGVPADVPALMALLHDADPDVRVGAANAVLNIERRHTTAFRYIDWIVLAGYAIGMLAIGWYCSRKTKDTSEYLLAGGTMKPWAVGVSYFATMFSTISYLAIPGEMIQHGPMIFSQILFYPIAFVVVGYVLIPFIMRLRITSAYEILEERFGLSVRMLGSFLFMLLRIIWMSFIVFATSKTVLVPLLHVDSSATPWMAAGLGVLTIAYTSMGGLRAVIWTDVAQAFILALGAVLSIVMICIHLGGATAWWPDAWADEWDTFKIGFDPTARVTLLVAAMSQLVWCICTAGSDQMAIQRYLATRNAKSARRMFGISLACDAFVAVLLAILGLALFAYFRSHPQRLPENQTLTSGADQLLPHFIVQDLPPGISGLVIAGLLAAAMSSLASGISSGCSVITVDWIDRFRVRRLSETAHVHLARVVSWVLGAIVVLVSMLATLMRGNLLEGANKLVNLLTAPLFVLFFMAMFVPWATTLGAWSAGIASVAAAMSIAYGDFTGLSFLWVMPGSLIVGVLAGCLVSLLPIGEKRPMLTTLHPTSNRSSIHEPF